MPIANYSTTVSVDRTLMEIQRMLTRAGAVSVRVDYTGVDPIALAFLLPVGETEVAFRLPIKPDGVAAALQRDSVPASKRTPEHVRRVAWRTVRDWLRAQLALIEAEQATLAEAMLPYAVTPSGRTLYQELEYRGPGLLLLESGMGGEKEET